MEILENFGNFRILEILENFWNLRKFGNLRIFWKFQQIYNTYKYPASTGYGSLHWLKTFSKMAEEEEEEQEEQDVRNKFLGSLEFLAIKNI